jgi:hypothetical protein
MDAPDQAAEQDVFLEGRNRLPGTFRRRLVGEHHKDAGEYQQGEQHERHAAEPERVRKPERSRGHLCRPQMENQ